MIDTVANRIVGWKASRSARTDFVLAALEQALHARRSVQKGGLIHHSDRLNPPNTSRSATPGVWQKPASSPRSAASVMPAIEPVDAIGSRPLARAVAETINGLCKTEVIRRRKLWRTIDEVEMETLKWVDGFNHRRLLEPIGNIPPAEAEEAFYANLYTLDMVA